MLAGQATVWLTLQQKGHSYKVNKEALFSRPWRAPEDVLAERAVTLKCMSERFGEGAADQLLVIQLS